jgi:microcystin-dependent protein|tara:strand:- start:440 stop:1000 length:561 start_codon:yes stop_codon:yes gene_type:complete
MANYEATKYDFTGGNLTGIDLVNTGLIIPWSDSSIPSGFLECNGANVSRSTYSALFAVIGTTYGAGDGSSTFGLPDLQDNVPVGKSPTKALASTGGANAVTSSGSISGNASNHSLSGTDTASHTHTVNFATTSSYMSGNTRPNAGDHNSSNTGGSSGHSHSMSATFSGGSDSVLQPYITMIYIIKT